MPEGKKEKINQTFGRAEAFQKATHYCAYQERCHEEVKNKLAEWGLYGSDAAEILHELVEQNYLDEERYARAFAGGKFRTKKWGRVKIRLELKSRKVSDYCINQGMKEIDVEEYHLAMKELIMEKDRQINELNLMVRKRKLATYMTGKGYEHELVWNFLGADDLDS